MQNQLNHLLTSLGITLSEDALLVGCCLLGIFIGYILARVVYRRQQAHMKADFGKQSEAIKKSEQTRLDDQLDQLNHSFSSLSQDALRLNNESFLSLAKQSFSQLQSNAQHDLKSREQNFANLIKPIQESISATDKQLKKFDVERKITETKLDERIGSLLNSQHALQSETRNLVTALRRPEVRGQWGELTLRRLVELAGMSEHCDFDEQPSLQSESGLIRPDMIIRLPSDRILVVDVKTPLDAYISASEEGDIELQEGHLKRHAKNVKERIKELAKKQYWEQFKHSPDFVILFIPGDQFLSAALEKEKDLLEFALEKRTLLATPTSLVGLLRAIAYGWNQDSVNKNSDLIRETGEVLYQRLVTLTKHLNLLGKSMETSIEHYNKLIGSYESKALPAAKKLSAMGIDKQQEIEVNSLNNESIRELKSPKE